MMNKALNIRVKPETKEKLYRLAEVNHRLPGQQLDAIIAELRDVPVVPQQPARAISSRVSQVAPRP